MPVVKTELAKKKLKKQNSARHPANRYTSDRDKRNGAINDAFTNKVLKGGKQKKRMSGKTEVTPPKRKI